MTDTIQVALISSVTAIVLAVVGGLFHSTNKKIGEVHILINNRMDQLLKAAKSESHAAGMVEGRAAGITEQRDRVTESERKEDRAEGKLRH